MKRAIKKGKRVGQKKLKKRQKEIPGGILVRTSRKFIGISLL